MTRWLTDSEQRAWRGYQAVQAQLSARLNRQLQTDSGLSLADYEVLVALTDRPEGQLRVFELAEALQWEQSRLSHHLARMQQRGLVNRRACREDRRGSYVLVTTLACVGYGAVFLMCGILFRNPMIAAAVVWVWENLNPFLPSLLKKISVIFYLKNLCPVEVPIPPPFNVMVVEADPTPFWLAVPGLLAVALILLVYSAISARKLEISYGE